MAALDFPASPTVGQTATLTNGFTYQWDGAVWTLAASTGQQAGGDLTGTYPNPLIGPGAVGNAEISDVAYGKITGAPAALPPSGAAGGDLTGTYPNPTVAKAAGSFSVGGNITAASSNLSMGGGTMPGLLQMLGGTDGRTFLSSNHPYAPGDTTKSSWIIYMDPVNDSTLIGRRPPNAAVGAVNWSLTLTNNGKTSCTLADNSITKTMVTPGQGVRTLTGTTYTYAAASNITSTTAVTIIAGNITTTGGAVLVWFSLNGIFYPNVAGWQYCVLDLLRDGGIIAEWVPEYNIPTGSFSHGFPNPSTLSYSDWNCPAGAHTFSLTVRVGSSSNIFRTGNWGTGNILMMEIL